MKYQSKQNEVQVFAVPVAAAAAATDEQRWQTQVKKWFRFSWGRLT